MTFLWSDIEFDWSPMSLRYYNDLCWYFYNSIQILPNFAIGFYKLYKYLNEKNGQKNYNTWDNKIPMLFVIFLPIYYFNDFMISIYEGSWFYPCRFALWYHHLLSMYVCPIMLSRMRFEWYEMFIMGIHSLLMWYPKIFLLSVIYCLFIIYFNLQLYMKTEQNKRWQNQILGKFFPFMYYAFILMLTCEDGVNGLPYLY